MKFADWWEQVRHDLRLFVSSKPGQRFIDAYSRRNRRGNQLLVTTLTIGGGAVLVIVGLLLAMVPGVPGIILGIPGLAMIASRSSRVASDLDWVELKCRKILRNLKRRRSTA